MVYIDYLPNVLAIKSLQLWILLDQARRCDSPYKICPVEGKGLGMTATKDIKKGELIVVERPVLLMRTSGAVTGRKEDFTRSSLLYLSSPSLQGILDLHNAHPPSSCNSIMGILNTNFLGASMPFGSDYCALYLTISRANHSCVFNAEHGFRPGGMRGELSAVRDINEGEEVTITYCKPKSDLRRRREELEDYGFECTCERCLGEVAAETNV